MEIAISIYLVQCWFQDDSKGGVQVRRPRLPLVPIQRMKSEFLLSFSTLALNPQNPVTGTGDHIRYNYWDQPLLHHIFPEAFLHILEIAISICLVQCWFRDDTKDGVQVRRPKLPLVPIQRMKSEFLLPFSTLTLNPLLSIPVFP